VQEYVEGSDLSSLSIACDGRIVLHCTYELPATAGAGYGLSYRSISDSGTLAVAEAIADDAAYTGFLGLDYMLGDDLRVIECNPRCTPGALLFEHSQLVAAILDPASGNPLVAPPAGASSSAACSHAMRFGIRARSLAPSRTSSRRRTRSAQSTTRYRCSTASSPSTTTSAWPPAHARATPRRSSATWSGIPLREEAPPRRGLPNRLR
jgi:hypothetical protein